MERTMRLNLIPQMAAALFVGMLISGMAQAADTPAALAGAKLVAADDVVKARSAGAVVIDSRVASEYAEGHIKDAVNVPYRRRARRPSILTPARTNLISPNCQPIKQQRSSFTATGQSAGKASRLRR
jgi:hypothetical protein